MTILDIRQNLLMPEFCYLINDEQDFRNVKNKIRHLQRWAKTCVDDSKITVVAFRVTNHSTHGFEKDNYLKWWKERHNNIDYPYPELIKPIKAKIVAGFWLQDMHKDKFDINDNFELVSSENKQLFFYKDMYSVDLISYALNKDDCTLFDEQFIRYHKTYYKSKVYKQNSDELVDWIYPPESFEFALDPLEMRRKDLKMISEGK